MCDAGNNWGKCESGREAMGCGPQETYRNCADIAIRDGAGIRGPYMSASLLYAPNKKQELTKRVCGQIQWRVNDGRCGPCGDRWDEEPPRPNETGGKYATNVTVRVYRPGQTIDVILDIVANHLGWYRFELCPDPMETEDCFDDWPLRDAETLQTRVPVPRNDTGLFFFRMKLPERLTCDRCVLRWHWFSGESIHGVWWWGSDVYR
ncbi:hypothetical protein LAZ67_10002887 [Cordylochernes scorpioides]|uniref:Chitin-binding type-4 domain-containing protein n=1 Tax=Cordylochernes scorpioides TaxID=51811 RepID=A0ABY6KXF7_9ARAC|nr:hypothetical protein LAZ67_10002887 [Cordylochernes scorpioides]